jgi:hypothetical protein
MEYINFSGYEDAMFSQQIFLLRHTPSNLIDSIPPSRFEATRVQLKIKQRQRAFGAIGGNLYSGTRKQLNQGTFIKE